MFEKSTANPGDPDDRRRKGRLTSRPVLRPAIQGTNRTLRGNDRLTISQPPSGFRAISKASISNGCDEFSVSCLITLDSSNLPFNLTNLSFHGTNVSLRALEKPLR